MAQIWFIHGAASTPVSFNFLKAYIHNRNKVDVAYETSTPLKHTIARLRGEASKCGEPPILIGHSLGGIIAAAIAQEVPVAKIVTIGTPFGGSFVASVVSMFATSQLMKDVAYQSPIIVSLKTNPPKVPMLSFVTESGPVVFGEKTDGVVTVKSQMALAGPEYRNINYNHFEVLLTPDVAYAINEFISN